jgi:hypothetical protein
MRKTKASFEPSLPPFRVHAFGAGVQSTSLLYAWALENEEEPRADGTMWRGFFPQGRPDLALFECVRAFVEVNEPHSLWRRATRSRLWSVDPRMAANVASLFEFDLRI